MSKMLSQQIKYIIWDRISSAQTSDFIAFWHITYAKSQDNEMLKDVSFEA